MKQIFPFLKFSIILQRFFRKGRHSTVKRQGFLCSLVSETGLGVLLVLLSCRSVTGQGSSLPNFKDVSSSTMQLTNTNGQWVTVNAAQPNNIDFLESRIFKMPRASQGILGVEFKLVGGDGGTAHYQSGAYNTFANGGRGGEVNFRLNLKSTNTYEKPFLVTFGKKGESTKFGSGMYCSAGGGGSTGMAWLTPEGYSKSMLKRWGVDFGQLIAAAGGGSGGYADGYASVHGKNATRDAGVIPIGNFFDAIYNLYRGQKIGRASIVSGGSKLDYVNNKPASCCTNELKARQTSSVVNNVFDAQIGVVLGSSGLLLKSVTLGQTGGKPTTLYDAQEGSSNTNNSGVVFSIVHEDETPVIKPGGKGGSGMAGGGAGSSTIDYYNGWVISFPSERTLIPTSGAGGTGSIILHSYPHTNLETGDDGYNDYSPFLENVSISQRSSTNSPQSGYFMYRTIIDSEAPVINISQISMNISSGTQQIMPFIQQYVGKENGITDNDGIKSIVISPTQLTCTDAGQTIPVFITVTDFVTNSRSSVINITVTSDGIVPSLPEESPYINDPDFPRRINITGTSYTLTAANFPQASDGCNGNSGITVHFPATTFTCFDAGTEKAIEYYYTNAANKTSATYTKTFLITYSGPVVERLYVDQAATGTGNGASWANAFKSLQDALNYNSCPNSTIYEIYVAKGTYRPDLGNGITLNHRSAAFNIPRNLKIYGGFPNGGGDLANRDPDANPTILSGEIGTAGITDNSYHVVSVSGNTELDGFTIRDGYFADDGDWGGGGLYVNMSGVYDTDSLVAISNCKFLNNYSRNGGAVAVYYGNNAASKKLNFKNCEFKDNIVTSTGGAVFIAYAPKLQQSFVNCVFVNNNAPTGLAGCLYTADGTQTNVTNCTFANNSAALYGTIYNRGALKIHNSILYFNTPSGIANVAQGTASIDYSNIQGSGGSQAWSFTGIQDMGNNIDTDPLFYSSTSPILTSQSPSRNTGLNSYNKEPYDIDNNARISQDVIDMGAYEIGQVLYVAADAPAGGDGNSWTSAINNLSDGIRAANLQRKNIWLKEGTYKPDRIPGSNTITSNNRDNSFFLNEDLAIYGGFAGKEKNIGQRSIGQHPTILSGDLGIQGVPGDNAYHVVTMKTKASRLDGLIIESGCANGAGEKLNGAGVYEEPDATGSNNVVVNVTLRNNISIGGYGGAWYTVAGNSGKTDFVQCLFYGNVAARGAAAFLKMPLQNTDSYDFNFYNVTAFGNTTQGGSVTGAFEGEQAVISVPARINAYNSIWSGNAPQNYSDVTNPGHITLTHTYTATAAGVFVDFNNITGTDGKIMTADDGLRLLSSSPAINYGVNASAYLGIDQDITGQKRVFNNIDAGAYESSYNEPLSPDATGIIYVKKNATGSGVSWANATGDLHHAIQVSGVQKVFVAKGVYPVGDHSFIMKNGVEIYGGFDPDKGIIDLSHNRIMPDAADPAQGSILDGENVRPVVWNVFTSSDPLNNSAVLDGFTLTRGTFANGAGIHNIYSSPTFNNLILRNNVAGVSGAGIYNENSNPLLSNTLITGNLIVNTALGVTISGGGIANTAGSSPVLTNVTLSGNMLIAPLGTMKGAGMYSNNSSPAVYNTIIWNNLKNGSSGYSGADMEKEGTGTLTLKNSITQGYSTGEGTDNNKENIDPMFVSGYKLASASVAIDAGNNSLYTGLSAETKDLAGYPRVYDFTNSKPIDMGAYEMQGPPIDYSHVVFENDTVVYDAAPHSLSLQNVPQNVSVGYQITDEDNQTTVGNSATNAGIYTITATMTPTAAGTNTGAELRTATLTIDKAIALITTSHTQDFVYDGTVKNVTASLNHTETALTYGPQQGYTEAGGYWVTVSAPETSNYQETSENVALVIANAEITGIGLNDGTFIHDGQPKSLAITGTLPADAIVVYSDNKKTDIGTYTINALVQRPNYNDLWLTAEMTISSTLPVRWISFTARLSDDNHGVLDWKVDQSSVSDYQIERSSNAKDFRAIGTVTAGNSEGIAEYNFTDPVAATGTVYYRIKQTDLDGTYGYSRIVSVKSTEGTPLTAYPNPVSQKITVQLGAAYIGTSLKLANTAGVILQQIPAASESFELNLDKYPAGLYMLYTWDGRAVKLVKN